jgi:hypothetical protein
MPRIDRSVTIMTGMIIAALYVILLVGFTRESYMARDASRRAETTGARHAETTGARYVVHDLARKVCRIDPPLCAGVPDGEERQNCLSSIEALRRLIGEPLAPLTLDRLRRAMADDER